ncbi:CPBP family intramembrane metalloprotease [Fluviicola sp. SGL-29]|nr:CPBP family intramembrane metalloprotease [Fluviicola sp. SGL-29]
MSFQSPYPLVKNSISDYIFALLIILGAYIAGNIPLLVVFSQLNASSADIIYELQRNLGNTVTFVLLLFPWITVFVSVPLISKFILRWPFEFLITGRKKIDYKRLGVGFGLWFLLCTITFFVSRNDLVVTNFNVEKFIPLVVVASCVLLVQCAAEELIFRSFLLKWMSTRIQNGLILSIITGTIFGYLHASNPEVEVIGNVALVYYIGTGIFLGLIAIIDDGLELTIGFHFANNLFAALIVTSNWQVFQTDALFLDTNPPAFTWVDFITAFGGQMIFFLICWKVYKWKSAGKKILNEPS